MVWKPDWTTDRSRFWSYSTNLIDFESGFDCLNRPVQLIFIYLFIYTQHQNDIILEGI